MHSTQGHSSSQRDKAVHASQPSKEQTVVYELKACRSAPTTPALRKLSSCILISPSPWEALPNFELLEHSSAQNLHCFTSSLPAFFLLLLRQSLAARFAGGFLLSENKQSNMAQGPNASHQVLHCSLRPLSFKYLKIAERQGPQESILPNPSHQHTNHIITSTGN